MRGPFQQRIKPVRHERGAAAVELAIIAIPFFFLLFSMMEFGRLLYLWNTVQEVTRHAARQAVVANFNDPDAVLAVRRNAVMRTTDGPLPGAPEVTHAHVVLRFLNAAGNPADPLPLDPGDNISACLDSTRTASCIRFVEACLSTGTTCSANERVSFVPFSPFLSDSGLADFTGLRIPLSTVRMPAESLGFSPF